MNSRAIRNVGQNTENFGNLLFPLPVQEKTLIRKLEKLTYKLNAAETAITFNTTCINEGLLPKYTQVRLHDPNAADDCHTRAFRRRLAERQLQEKESEARKARDAVNDLRQQWRSLHEGEDRTNIINTLARLQDADRHKKEEAVLSKLINLNGGKLRLPRHRQNYINLTEYTPNQDEEALLQLGLNCHYADKPLPKIKRLEIEVLLDNLLSLEKERKVLLSDSLRPLLLAEALTQHHPDNHHSIMSKKLRDAAKKLKTTEDTTIRRADKTPALVLIKTCEYHQKLDAILADATKFRRIRKNPVEEIKKEANNVIERVNALSTSTKFSRIRGDYEPGYIYGNVKTHKNGNPLRPIISQIPSPTYRLAKQLNTLLSPYIPSKYRVKSSPEFLHAVRSTTPEGTIASLDVESLFTNVPVDETIDLICERVYRNDGTPTLAIPEDALRTLLRLCTMKAPFITHKGEMYTQIDGIAMGSPLGVLFADFYMGVVEERVFSQHPMPSLYCRYVDDTFVKAQHPEDIEKLRRCFEDNSVLHFTSENSVDGKLPFLDVLLAQTGGSNFTTSVYKKPTNMGLCLNGRSECPVRYKRAAINAYIRRALTHCSTWKATTDEIENASQVLVNNGFSNKEIGTQVKKAIDKWYTEDSNSAPLPAPEEENIKLFYKNQMHNNYKKDESVLREIISNNVSPVNPNSNVNLIIYYKNKKTANFILKNNPAPHPDMLKKRNVVYRFTCPVERCPHIYIGMTTMRFSKRISCHVQEGAIHSHFNNIHNCTPTRDRILSGFEVIDNNSDPKRLRYLEAIYILNEKPSLNCTQEPLLLPSIVPPPQPISPSMHAAR